jgi:acetyl-CoA synthetase
MSKEAISTESLSHECRTFPPSPEVVQHALINAPQYAAMYQRSIREPDRFWLEQAQTLEWFKPPTSSPANTLGHGRAEDRAHLV